MSNEENFAEQLLDVLVYAPIGLLLEAKDLIPRLADRGRGQVALVQVANRIAGGRRSDASTPLFHRVIDAAGVALGGLSTPDHESADEPDDHASPGEDDVSLPIEDYDSYSAAQLPAKLETLTRTQLDEILSHEQTHRNRRTVTNRIQQLGSLEESPPST